jgi:hypothetical protein
MEPSATNLTEIAAGLLPEDTTTSVMTVPLSHGTYDPWSLALMLIPFTAVVVLAALYVAGVRGNRTSMRIQAIPSVMKTFLIVAMAANTFALLNSIAGKLELWMRLDSVSRPLMLTSGLAICFREYSWSLLLLVVAIPMIVHLRRRVNQVD